MPTMNEMLALQKKKLQEMYMDPMAKLQLEKKRKAERERHAVEEAERIANLPPEGMTVEQQKGTKALFEIFDTDGQGKIHRNRMGSLLVKLGMDPTEQEIEESREKFDEDSDGFIDFREFTHMAQHVRRQSVQRTTIVFHDLDEEEEAKFRQEFQSYDKDSSGTIDRDELDAMLTGLDFEHTPQDLDAITNDIDKDGDGVLNFEEFVSLASRLRAMKTGDTAKAEELYSAWLKKCSQQLQQSKRAKQAAVSAAKKEFQKGSTIEKALETANNAAAAANGSMKDIAAACSHVEQKLHRWVNEELYNYSAQGKLEEVEACMRKGGSANWENPDKDGFTPLMAACEMNRDNVVEVLAKWYSTSISISCSPAQTTATHLAAKHRDCKCLKILIEEGADLYSKCRPNDCPVLSIASQFGNINGVKLLLQGRAPINGCDSRGWSPLMATIAKKQFDCATFIVAQCNPDMNTLSKDGKSALDIVNDAIAVCTDSVPIILQDLQEFKIVLTRNGGRTGRDLRASARAKAIVEREVAEQQAENFGASFVEQQDNSGLSLSLSGAGIAEDEVHYSPSSVRPPSSKRGQLLSEGNEQLLDTLMTSGYGGGDSLSLEDDLNALMSPHSGTGTGTGTSLELDIDGSQYGSGRRMLSAELEPDYAKSAYGAEPSPTIRSGLRTGRRSVASIPKIDKIVRHNANRKGPNTNTRHLTTGRGLASPESSRKPRPRKLYGSTSFHM